MKFYVGVFETQADRKIQIERNLISVSSPSYLVRNQQGISTVFSGKNPQHLHLYISIKTISLVSQNHRITESQNSRDWKGPLWVI